jgi:hypothetical protein
MVDGRGRYKYKVTGKWHVPVLFLPSNSSAIFKLDKKLVAWYLNEQFLEVNISTPASQQVKTASQNKLFTTSLFIIRRKKK